MKIALRFAAALALLLTAAARAEDASAHKKLRIGVTLVPYFSFTANIVGDLAEVVPLIGTAYNIHGYQPQAADIENAMTLDVLVVNGIGHDEWAFEILDAAQMRDKIHLIYANKGVALFPVAGRNDGKEVLNPHTFISISSSVPQIYNIAEELGQLDPDNAATYRENARKYTAKLRRIKAEYMARLEGLDELDFRCATVHGGYDYLLHEFGLTVAAVIEPNHGAKPTASQMSETIEQIKNAHVQVLFSEQDFPDDFVETIERETGVKVRHLSHLTASEYTPEAFEQGIRANLEALSSALLDINVEEKK
ncbi:MAG: ABC transporter substrate-binding protein [Candidatus Hydrogenedens sp.]|nr:ABC transporter substrate-binding protein [Candidatus Hydrogenedens sp.]